MKIQRLKLFPFLKKTSVKNTFLEIFKLILFPTGLRCKIGSRQVLRNSGELSEKYNFATLGTLGLDVISTLKFKGC